MTRELNEIVSTISLTKHAHIVGSYSFIAHPYPGDIDMFEVYQGSGTPEHVARKIAKRFQKIGLGIQNRPETYLSDFKAGMDVRYQLDWNASLKQVEQYIAQLAQNKLLTPAEYKTYTHTLRTQSRADFYEKIREKIILRWNLEELIRGYKVLTLGKKFTLIEALQQQSVVKLDLITLVNGLYTEITNLFKLSAIHPQTGEIVHLSQPDTDYRQSLQNDLQKYSDPVLKKRMKYAKRLWSLSVLNHNTDTLTKLRPLLESGAARLSQICSLIETTLILYEKLKTLPKASFEQIQRLNFSIGSTSHNILSKANAEIVCALIYNIDTQPQQQSVRILERIWKILHRAVDRYAKQYLRKQRLLVKIN
jgi:hypothetical protein